MARQDHAAHSESESQNNRGPPTSDGPSTRQAHCESDIGNDASHWYGAEPGYYGRHFTATQSCIGDDCLLVATATEAGFVSKQDRLRCHVATNKQRQARPEAGFEDV
jgi:hypothetical protein